jgi:tail tube protein
MPEAVNEGAYRISGRFGEGFYVPSDGTPPLKLIEATAIEFTVEIGQTDVPIPGRNKTGTKDGPESRSGTMTIQKLDSRFENIVFGFLNYSIAERRRLRDQGIRPVRTFTLQVWLDDPDALGAEGWQIEGVRLSRLMGGFNTADELTNREHPFRYETERKLAAYERLGNTFDPATGLPAIRYTDRVA